MTEERLLLLNLRSIHRRHLFEAASSMVEEEHYGLAVVVAQAAIEVAFETAIAFALQVRAVPNPVSGVDRRRDHHLVVAGERARGAALEGADR